jgi:hypothetical protein
VMSDAIPDSNNDPFDSAPSFEQEAWLCSEWRHPSVDNFESEEVERSPGSNSPGDLELEESDLIDGAEEVDVDIGPANANVVDNAYITSILEPANLHILQPGQVSLAYHSEKLELNLFHLFFTKNYLETVCRWTNEVLEKKGLKSCTSLEFFAYIGLELGMSLLKYNSIKSYWGNGSFLGHETYKQCMPQNRFQQIRASVWFCSLNSYDSEMASSDPLRFCRSL